MASQQKHHLWILIFLGGKAVFKDHNLSWDVKLPELFQLKFGGNSSTLSLDQSRSQITPIWLQHNIYFNWKRNLKPSNCFLEVVAYQDTRWSKKISGQSIFKLLPWRPIFGIIPNMIQKIFQEVTCKVTLF